MGCYDCRGLGAIALAAKIGMSIISWMVNDRVSAGQAASMAADQYDEFKRMKEAEITGLALYLADNSQLPYWEWFNTLRSAQAYKLSQPDRNGNGEGNGAEEKAAIPQWVWIAAALGVVALVVMGD